MCRAEKFGVLLAVSFVIAASGILPAPAGPAILRAQNLKTELTARARVFADAGPGLAALIGYAAYEISLAAEEFEPGAAERRRDVLMLERRNAAAHAKPAINAIGVDAASEETWIAIGNALVHFDKDGARRSTHYLFLPDDARLEPKVILVEQERLLAGAGPIGVFEFEKPDRNLPAARAK
jgi:hypothetical protein